MKSLGLERDIVDQAVYDRSVRFFRERAVRLPTFSEIARPDTAPRSIRERLASVDPDAPDPLNLFRVHWYNGPDRRSLESFPDHLVLTRELTGVDAPILVAIGNRFPLIRAHKVLAAYACLAPRLVTGQFDPEGQRAIWPSTGNYCRGGVAISRILGCRGIAVLPEGMSAERFRWLESWVTDPADIVRTPGTESNVKEIYDECGRLEQDSSNIVFNQFCEFGNHLVHEACTGPALGDVWTSRAVVHRALKPVAFVSATGSAGTLGAGDFFKDEWQGCKNVAVEALECPTLLYNGYGEHNIQGIGDKHVPFIHNVQNTDIVAAVSDKSTDALNVLFNTEVGRAWLRSERGVPADMVAGLANLGLSSICNVLASIKVAKQLDLDGDCAVMTVATDGAELYESELEKTLRERFPDGFDEAAAAAVYEEHLAGVDTDHLLELGPRDRDRIFNLGYFTWVEQQGVALEDFEARRAQSYWRGLRDLVPVWDEMITAFNGETGA